MKGRRRLIVFLLLTLFDCIGTTLVFGFVENIFLASFVSAVMLTFLIDWVYKNWR